MKLIIREDISAQKAMEYISRFLEEECGDYPLLNSQLNVYIQLKDSKNRFFPKNGKEYVLGSNTIRDIEQEKIIEAKEKTLHYWIKYFQQAERILQNQLKEIEKDEKYLSTALEKGRTEATVQRRKEQYEIKMEKLSQLEKMYSILCALDEAIKDGCVEWDIKKNTPNKNTPYIYTFDAELIFDDVAGFDGCFRVDNSKGTLIENFSV